MIIKNYNIVFLTFKVQIMSKALQTCFMKKSISIPTPHKNKLVDFIYLDQSKVAISLNFQYLVIDFNLEVRISRFDNTKKEIQYGQQILPYKKRGFIVCERYFKLIGTDNKITRMSHYNQNFDSQGKWEFICFFHQSQKIFSVVINYRTLLINLISQLSQKKLGKYGVFQNKCLKIYQNKASMTIFPVDQESLFLLRYQNGSLCIYDVQKLQQENHYELSLPFPKEQKLQLKHLFYVLNKQLGLIGKLQNEVFTLIKIQLNVNGFKQILIMFQNIKSGYFLSLNKQQNLVAILLMSPDLVQRILVYDYCKKCIYWEHNVLCSRSIENYKKQLNRSLSEFVDVEIGQNNIVINYFYRPKSKKMIFHLIKKSNLWNSFGQKLAYKVLQLMA